MVNASGAGLIPPGRDMSWTEFKAIVPNIVYKPNAMNMECLICFGFLIIVCIYVPYMFLTLT